MKRADYILYTDGGSRGNPGQAAYGFVIYNNTNRILFEEGKRIGVTTNNVAEYTAVLHALLWIKNNHKKPSPPSIKLFLDSELVARQLNGMYRIKKDSLQKISFTIKRILTDLHAVIEISHIKRSYNKAADKLVNLALDYKI